MGSPRICGSVAHPHMDSGLAMIHTHGKFKQTVNNHRTGFTVTAFLLVIAAFWFGLNENQNRFATKLQNAQEETTRVLYLNSLEACERGNKLRTVVYANTKQAAAIEPGATYSRQLRFLRSAPYTNPVTGTINCAAAIDAP